MLSSLTEFILSYGCHQNMVNVIVCYCCHYLLFMLSPIIMSLVSYRCHHFAVVVAYRCCLLSMWLALINVIDSNRCHHLFINAIISYPCHRLLSLMLSLTAEVICSWCLLLFMLSSLIDVNRLLSLLSSIIDVIISYQGCGYAFILCGSGSSSFSEFGSGSGSRSSLTKFEEK